MSDFECACGSEQYRYIKVVGGTDRRKCDVCGTDHLTGW